MSLALALNEKLLSVGCLVRCFGWIQYRGYRILPASGVKFISDRSKHSTALNTF